MSSRRRLMMAMAMMAQEPELALVFSGAQYIDTLYKPSSNTRVILNVNLQDTFGDGQIINWTFGSRGASHVGAYCFAQRLYATVPADGARFAYHSTGILDIERRLVPFGEWLNIDANRNTVSVDGADIATAPAASFQATYNLLIGNLNDNVSGANLANGGKFKLRDSLKIYDNDILVRDFVPVRSGSTRYSATPAPSNCLWDKVSKTYFENQGTGSFGVAEI